MKILTIIIPAYNVERYIDRCLSSVASLEGKGDYLDKIEAIVIDDGSKDGTAGIAQAYVDRYPGVFSLIRKDNGGHGSCINTGTGLATGKYLKILDSDDWLGEDAIPGYLDILCRSDRDLIASDFLCVEDGTNRVLERKQAAPSKDLYGKVIDLDRYRLEKVVKMHSFTIRTAILKEHFRPIDEGMPYVDQEFITYPVPYIKTVLFDGAPLYHYRVGRQGQSMDRQAYAVNRKRHRETLDSLISFYGEVCGTMELSGNRMAYLRRCVGDMIDNQFQFYIAAGDQPGVREELKEWDQGLRVAYPRLWGSVSKKSIRLLRKTDYKILGIGNKVWRAKKKI